MSILTTIVTLLGKFFAAILPAFIAEWKKPRSAEMVGDDPEIRDDIDATIESSLDSPDSGIDRDGTRGRDDGVHLENTGDETP